MAAPITVITRACEYGGKTYTVGQQVINHGHADRLIRLGFAQHQAPAQPERHKPAEKKEA